VKLPKPAQLEREITETLAGTATDKQPLHGHTSEATAYLVADYPYGFRERTQIRYWLEAKPKRGWRFVSQTLNPKTDRWNKPKESTYFEGGGGCTMSWPLGKRSKRWSTARRSAPPAH
jgi:hypothetical protein